MQKLTHRKPRTSEPEPKSPKPPQAEIAPESLDAIERALVQLGQPLTHENDLALAIWEDREPAIDEVFDLRERYQKRRCRSRD
jgi:hypothetical protein